MIPYPLFRRRDMGLMAVVAAAMGAALYSVFYFVGIYVRTSLIFLPPKATPAPL